MSRAIVARLILCTGLTLVFATTGIASENREEPAVHVSLPKESSGCYDLPKRSDIQQIEVELYSFLALFGVFPAVGPFQLPETHYETILEFFAHPLVDTRPPLWCPEIGSIKFIERNGNVTRLSYFWKKGTGGLLYSIRGVRCVDGRDGRHGDEGLLLDLRLRQVYRDLTGHVVTEYIRRPNPKE